MAAAFSLIDSKKRYQDGHILQMRLWVLPSGAWVRGSAHELKYSLFYGRPGVRLLCYDNEAGKGDHVHRNGVEEPYIFSSPQKLIADFLAEVETLRGERP